ncbi:hypothetical protein HYT45_02615 [Candidatus Uhrbacteria bacterium]|nr:hypothetical protein [Candidatus Uhrbacteria bacterium]
MNDSNGFREKLFLTIGRTFSFVSTIDHPYVSPPAHLLDAHHTLFSHFKNGNDPLLLVWDTHIPDSDMYRQQFTFDCGILSLNDPRYWIFEPNNLVSKQLPRKIDFLAIRMFIEELFEKKMNIKKIERELRKKSFLRNFDSLTPIYQNAMRTASNGSEFSQVVLKELYSFLGYTHFRDLLENKSLSYFQSDIISEWIPYCIVQTENTDFSFRILIDKGLLKAPFFRQTNMLADLRLADKEYILKNMNSILFRLKNKEIIPSSSNIFFWTLALCKIPHFGNDHGFFNKLQKARFLEDNDRMQMTEPNMDARSPLQYEKVIIYSMSEKRDKQDFNLVRNAKVSRFNTLPSFICNLGLENVKDLLSQYFELKIPIKVDMIFH